MFLLEVLTALYDMFEGAESSEAT